MFHTNFEDTESWINQHRIANILSIHVLEKLEFLIMYDCANDFWIVTKYGVSAKFHGDKQGMPYINASEQGSFLCVDCVIEM